MLNSFKYAFHGIRYALKDGRNFRIMAACFIIVVIAGILFGLSGLEWAAVLLCCAGVLSFEMVNTALESTVNIVTDEYKLLAKKAKDAAAGATLVFSLFSVAIGLIIFIPHIIDLIS